MRIIHSLNLSPLKDMPKEMYFKDDLNFNSYFNTLSWDKWHKYCGIKNLTLEVSVKGSYEITVTSTNDQYSRFITFSGNNKQQFQIPKDSLFGHISIQLHNTTLDCIEYINWLSPEYLHFNKISVAGVFCTFNRDNYLFNNVETILNKKIKDFDLFIIDNASRIPLNHFVDYGDKCKLFHTPNTGGSGGFTRGIIEALNSNSNYTHILVMDDDITIDPAVIERTINFLSCLRPEYREHFISGSMLLMDEPTTLFESSASWSGIRLKNHKTNLDMTNPIDILESDSKNIYPNTYAAWWYCAFPVTDSTKEHLPYPFFICGDDMDYSLSHAKGIITLPGIGVWHESFKNKFAPLVKSYFFTRNSYILNSLHPERYNKFHTLMTFTIHYYILLGVHDYRSVKLLLQSMNDFLLGATDMLKIKEKDLLATGHMSGDMKEISIEELRAYKVIPVNFNRFRSPLYFFNKKIAAKLTNSNLYETRTRSWKSIFTLQLKQTKLILKLLFSYKSIAQSYRDVNRTIEFWQNRYDEIMEK